MGGSAAVDWSAIDTVLLDMDGTLLDLRFDTWFWQEHLPREFAAAHGMTPAAARTQLEPRFEAARGSLNWYCIDHWSRELGLDIGALKRAVATQVSYLPRALDFLCALKAGGKRRVLVTNAHPLTLAIKDAEVALTQHVDASHSAHDFGAPKEDPHFWARFAAAEPFIPGRTLLIDDNLAVLDAARAFGIGCLRAVRCPESGRPPRSTGDHLGVDGVADLIPARRV